MAAGDRAADTAADTAGDTGGVSAAVAAAAAERMTFFSDAVVAIAITLLAIELPVPDGATSTELWHSLTEHSFEYLAFLISFVVIATHWRGHHRLFRWVRTLDSPVIQLNFGWLLLIVINPFLTRVLTEGEMNFLRFALYAVAQALQACLFAVMIEVIRRREWFDPAMPPGLAHRSSIRLLIGSSGFLLSLPFFPLIGQWAFAVWAGVPMVMGAVLRRTGLLATA